MDTQNLNELSDELLLAQIQNGDDDAMEALIEKYEKLLRAIINGEGITNRADENDVFGEICFALVKQVRKDATAIREVDKWLKQVARNKCADFGRAAKKHHEAVALGADIRRAVVDREARRGLPDEFSDDAVMDIIEELGPKYVAVLELWGQRYTSAEIGEILGIPENTVKSRKTKIRKRLKEAFPDRLPPSKQS